MREGLVLEIAQLSELERQVLVERHLISRELSAHSDGAGIAVNRDQSCAIMMNEEDHLRIQVLRRGFALEEAWSAIDAVDTALEVSLDFAFTGGRGYLTACPTNVGTGLRASVMMHLPALVLSGHMEKVVRFANQLNLAVRGLFGEGSDASGSIFQISNQQTLGEAEQTIVEKLRGVLRAIVEQEQNARLKLLESGRRQLLDKIGRSRGILENCRIVTSSEAMNHLSLLRLAVDLGMLPPDERTRMDRLFIEVQPGHVQIFAGKTLESDERDHWRSRLLNGEIRTLPPLDFDNSPKRD